MSSKKGTSQGSKGKPNPKIQPKPNPTSKQPKKTKAKIPNKAPPKSPASIAQAIVKSAGQKKKERAPIRVPTNPDELPVCKTCLQRYGCQEKDAEGKMELLWRAFYDGVDDATGEPYRYPGTEECYVCWDDRRKCEPKGTTQDQVITKKKCIKTKAKIETRRAARVISKFRLRQMKIARFHKMKIARLAEEMHDAVLWDLRGCKKPLAF